MNTPEIDVHIEYTDTDHFSEVPYIRTPAIPRVGDFLHLPNGKEYRVDKVIFVEQETGLTQPWIQVRYFGLVDKP